jgi:glycosyltransferase involved in cell wall biosynthesis
LLLWAAPSLPRSIVGVVLTTAVLALAEGRLRWYLQLVPQAKRYHLPPELLQARAAGDGLAAKLVAIVPSLISVAVVAALGGPHFDYGCLHGVLLFVVPPEDPGALAAAVVRFFAEGLAARMRPEVERLRAAHSWEQLAERTVDLVDELEPARGWR